MTSGQWTPEHHGVVSMAPYVPTPAAGVAAAMRLAALGPDDIFADLGCGDGRLVVEAARTCRLSIGIELDEGLIAQAQPTLRLEGGQEENFRIIRGDAAEVDLRALGVTHAFVFMSPEGNERLDPRLREMGEGVTLFPPSLRPYIPPARF